jgi:RimJ/RimL family protein N-acetyltransferase
LALLTSASGEAYLRWQDAGPDPRKSEAARCEAAPPAVHRRLSGRESEQVLEHGPVLRLLFFVSSRETDRLLLRRWRLGDREPLAAINADPEVMRFIGTGAVLGRGLSDDLVVRFEREWATRSFGLWAVSARDDPEERLLGFCGLTVPMFLPSVLPAVEIGWRFARSAWGRGYATEAAREAIAFGFSECGVEEILAIVDPENERSLRVCEKLGMTARPDRTHPATRMRVRVLGVRVHS